MISVIKIALLNIILTICDVILCLANIIKKKKKLGLDEFLYIIDKVKLI